MSQKQQKHTHKKSGSLLNYLLLIVVLAVISGALYEYIKTPVGKGHLTQFINSSPSLVTIKTRNDKRYNIGGDTANQVLNQALLMKGNMLKEKFSRDGAGICTIYIYKNPANITFELIITFNGSSYLAKIHRVSKKSIFYYDGKYDVSDLVGVLNQRTNNICQ
jgi:hypothetical protein